MKNAPLLSALLLAFSLLLAPPAAGQSCSFVTGPDVIVGDLTSPSNYTSANGIEAFSMGTTSCNLGDQVLNWISGTPQHPVIAQNLYRLQDRGGWWAFEQVGMSWLKHGFAALQGNVCCTNCTPADGSHLGRGCSDPYSGSLNGSQSSLGPRWQVNARTGAFTYPPANPAWSGSTARRLQVAIADLQPTASSTTRYFGEGHYVTPDDAAAGNQNNNASYREIAVTGSGDAWNFSYIGPTRRQEQAIRAWQAVDPGVRLLEIQLPSEGLLILAWKVTELGGGTWHYEYALYNMNSDDGIGSFGVPLPFGVQLTNLGFHDVDYRNGDGIGSVDQSGADWTASVLPSLPESLLRWSTSPSSLDQNANALRWGTLYNFRFDADSPPRQVSITLGRFKTGLVHQVLAEGPAPLGQGPSISFCDGTDGSHGACPCGNAGTAPAGCDNFQRTGGARLSAQGFAPDGVGGGSVTMAGSGFPATTNPGVTLIRSPQRETPPVVFGDGLRCVSADGLVRVGSSQANAGQVGFAVQHGAGPGSFAYQLWYRSQPASFCDPLAAFNLSNGFQLTW